MQVFERKTIISISGITERGALPRFCPDCGTKLAVSQANFCPECGCALRVATSVQGETVERKDDERAEIRASIFELGNKLEEVVEQILQSKGYDTERRRRIQGKSGTRSEIDVIAKKRDKVIAIECKNYSAPVGIDKLRDFAQKLQDLGSQWNGIFVSYSGFTDGAAQFAQYRSIETWGHDEISEKWLAISVGRVQSRKGQSLTLEYALPLNVDFAHSTQLDLRNGDKVRTSGAELIYHPYFAVDYIYKGQVKDPTKKLHEFEDRDTLFVDALDGSVLNQMPTKDAGGVLQRALKIIVSSRARAENERNKKLLEELRTNIPLRNYSINIVDDYSVTKLKPVISPREAVQSCVDFITEKNTQKIAYYPKTDDDNLFQRSESITYVPKRKDVRIKRRDIAVVPKWSVDFDSFGKSYKREVLACSGRILEDTMNYCPKHFKIRATKIVSKRTVAVCEVCGQSLCKNHVGSCPTCSKWLCEEHGIVCSACQDLFCEEHITLICPICSADICDSCAITCPICNLQYGRDHNVTCDKCGATVCPDCVTTTGFIRKTRLCKNCED